MNFFNFISAICIGLVICLVSSAHAGGDKSAKTTVITLAGGGEKNSGYPIPIPIPVCSGRGHGGHGGFGGHGGHFGHYGAQSRMGWRR